MKTYGEASNVLLQFEESSPRQSYLMIKRIFDMCTAIMVLAILLVPMLLIALLIKLDSPGPAVFKQARVGLHGKIFTIYKFRTMYVDAPSDVATALLEHVEIFETRVGKILRKTSLDELPQFFNILKGDMSLVGYRPVCITEEKLNLLRDKYGVFVCRPGITGLAQIRGRDDLYYKDKAVIDAEYVQKMSLKLDLYCILKTIPVVIEHRGIR